MTYLDFAFAMFASASVLYAAGVVASFFQLKRSGRSEGALFAVLVFLGFILHLGAMSILWYHTRRAPVGNPYEMMEAVALLLAAFAVCNFPFARFRLVSTFLALIACALSAVPLFCPVFMDTMSREAKSAANFAGLHAFFAALSFAFLGLAFVFSILYLFQVRSLKRHDVGAFSRALMPMPRLASLSRWAVYSATCAISVSFLLGALAAMHVEYGGASYAIKYSLSGILFLMFVALFVSSLKDVDDARFAKFVILAFVLAILMIVPISIRSVI